MTSVHYNYISPHTDHLIDLALSEDVGSGDITTDHLPYPEAPGTGRMIAKQELVVAGLAIARRTFEKLDADMVFSSAFTDGDKVNPGEVMAEIRCSLRALLIGERTALNFLQHLSGIATNTRHYVKELGGARIRLADTRKTIPGWRVLEKYAVRAGGAHNHRMGLYDGVLIKDNHIAAFGGIRKAVDHIRGAVSHLVKIEIETSTLEEVREALAAGVDVIMLDNMDEDGIRAAVNLIDHRALVEVSGRVNRENLKRLAATGVDIISIGALIHSAPFVDISMRIFADT